jgi:hypothetical protein
MTWLADHGSWFAWALVAVNLVIVARTFAYLRRYERLNAAWFAIVLIAWQLRYRADLLDEADRFARSLRLERRRTPRR